LILTHVIEPIRSRYVGRLHLPGLDAQRRGTAEDALDGLVATVPRRLHPDAVIVIGDPAEEIAKLAQARRAGLIVMGLHGSPLLGPRMGSVTYRVLCLSQTLVLAVPPAKAAASEARVEAGFPAQAPFFAS
jgi:nucleotide-binding universal stress UspA family protein